MSAGMKRTKSSSYIANRIERQETRRGGYLSPTLVGGMPACRSSSRIASSQSLLFTAPTIIWQQSRTQDREFQIFRMGPAPEGDYASRHAAPEMRPGFVEKLRPVAP
jgi:hypothetical protein